MSMTSSGGYASDDDCSFVVVVTMGERGWRVADLGDDATGSLVDAAQVLRNLRSERVAAGILNIDDDYFILVRRGAESLRVVLSDATAAVTDDIVADVFDELDLDIPDLDGDGLNDVSVWAKGDMDILADLGCSEEALGSICDDQSLWTPEQLLAITEELGCAEELANAADLDYNGNDDDYGPYDD